MDQKELFQLENKCIQECAPWCTARCPVHVDVRAINAAICRGDFTAARAVFAKSVPFPGIISRICDHPCQDVCKRGQVGEAISIRDLEKASMSLGTDIKTKKPQVPRKPKRVAVVGAGLSGLTAAIDLSKKGYEVTIFEGSGRPGGSVLALHEEVLPKSIIENDMQILSELPITVRLDTVLGTDVDLSELEKDFDSIYLGLGRNYDPTAVEELHSKDGISIKENTFETVRPGIFAGGGCVSRSSDYSPIGSISHGRRAGISIDRYLQKVSLTASRDNEGPYETRLYTDISGKEPSNRVELSDPAGNYSAEEAGREADRCFQCECMECVKICDYLDVFKGYPKKYVRHIYNNLSIVMGHRHGNKFINSCSLCGLCKEVCPEDLHMGEVCKSARKTMVLQGKMPPSAHEFALRDMEFSNSDRFFLARHEPGRESSAFVFFPGCRLSASLPEKVTNAYEFLRRNLEDGVGLMLGCCGAPADWSGRQDLFDDSSKKFDSAWNEMGRPKIIAACSTCFSVLRKRVPAEKIVSLYEIMDQSGIIPDNPETGSILAVHDPCTTRHEAGIHGSVRNIVKKLGFNVEELPLSGERTECCGFGGLMRFANRELSDMVIDRRINETRSSLLTYCAMCRDLFASHGKPAYHILELVFGGISEKDQVRKGPDYSQSRENRFRLKRTLLKELWSESGMEDGEHSEIKMIISDELRERMEQRMILEEDLRKVIRSAEPDGTKLVHRETGRHLAHSRPSKVTYWVEYSKREDDYVIHNAYSHRMEIVEDVKP